MSTLRPCLSIVLCAGFALSAISIQAEPAYDLRALVVWTDVPTDDAPSDAQRRYMDMFNNGDPLVGGSYANGWAGTGSYTALGSPAAGAELNGPAPDYFGTAYGAGRMRFQFADSVFRPSNLDQPGTVARRESLVLADAAPPLLTSTRDFSAGTAWDFVTPDGPGGYGLMLTDNPVQGLSAGQPFDDLIELRVVRGSDGLPRVNLRRFSWDGSLLAISDVYNMNPANALYAGAALGDVALIDLELDYSPATPTAAAALRASFWLQDDHDGDLGGAVFPVALSIFHGEDTTQLAASAVWAAAVPEPGIWALLIAGLGVVALQARHSKRR